MTDASTPSNAAYFELEPFTLTVTNLPIVSITASPTSVNEDGVTGLTYTVTRTAPLASALTVNLSTSGTATSGSDYSGGVASVTLAANATSATVVIDPTADSTVEANETVVLTVASGAGYAVGSPSVATGTITNDDLPNLTINDVVLNEGNAGTTNATFTVSLSTPAGAGGVTFDIGTANGTATAGVDYVANTLTGQTIAQGASTYSFTVLVNGDLLNELSETFFANVTNVTGAITVDGQGQGTIVNDDPLGSFSINDVTITEGDAGTSLAVFTVSLSAASGQTATVNYATADGTAQAPGDYVAASGTLTFSPGVTTQTVSVTINGETAVEASETFTVGLSGATNATIADNTGTGTITNDDTTSVSIAVSPASVAEDGATNLTYTVTRSVSSASALTVNLSTSGTATSGTDYSGGVASVTIAANATTATVVINPTVDTTIEADETVILTVATGAGYAVGAPSAATGTITNDDFPSASIAVSPTSVIEDGATNLIYTLTLDQAPIAATTVNFTVSGTASNGTDFATIGSTASFAAGVTTATVTVNPTTDSTPEADETVILTLAAGTGYTLGSPALATGTITNDDLPNLTIDNVTLAEGNAGATNATFTVSLSAPAVAGGVSFDIGTANGTATAGVDYVANSLTGQTIAQGASTYTFTVLINGDLLNEPSETFFANVTNVTGAVVTDGQGLGTITNDDALPSLSINDVTVTEGDAGTSLAVFTVSLNAASAQTVTVNHATANGTAQAPADYVAASGTLTFSPGVTTQTVSVTINGDTTVEADETFTVGLSGVTNATIADTSGTGTITNDDVPVVTIAVSPATVLEDGAPNLIYTITLDRASVSATSVTLTTSGTATSGTDYAAITSPLVIAAGSTTGTVTVNPTTDAGVEPNETVILTVGTGTGYTVGSPASATATILDDDLPTVSIDDVSLSEGNAGTTNASFTVSLSSPAGAGGVTFDIATTNATATGGVDYVTRSLSAQTIASGASSYVFTVLINGDLLNEPTETFLVDITNVAGAVVGDGQGLGTIINDDGQPAFSVNDVSVTEGNSGTTNAVFTVSLDSASGQTATINFATANSTASSGSDYTANSGTLTFAPGTVTQTVTVAVSGDVVVEGDETFALNLSGATNATISDAAGQGTIINDDAVPLLTGLAPTSGPASGGTSVTLTGTALTGATSVRFGATPAASYTVDSATSITATAPAGTGAVDLTVTTPSGTSATTASARFTYIDAPVASGLTLTSPYNPDAASFAPLDLSTAVTGSVSSYAVGTASNGSVSVVGAQARYTPNVGYAGPDSFTFTATGPGGTSNAATVNVTVSIPALTLAPGTLTNGQRGQAYAATLTASGGVGPYGYTVTGGSLPTGVTLSAGGTLSGTPQASGAFNVTITATDSSTGAGPFTVVRGYALNIDVPTVTLTPTAGALPGATVGASYSGSLSASGGVAPYGFAVTAGALPAGLTLAADGNLTGTPSVAGSFTFTITATDAATAGSGGPYGGSSAYSLVVGDAAPVAAATSVTVGYSAVATSVPLVLTGGPTTSVAVAAAPARGVATVTGTTLTYTPTAGAYGPDSFTYTATGPGGTSAPATVSVTISAPTLTLAPSTLTNAQEDVAYSSTLTASGGTAAYSFVVTAGALPTGLTLTSAGVLSGVPTAAGSYAFTVTVTDSSTGVGPASIGQALTLIVGAPPPPVVITPPGTIPAEGGSRGGEPLSIDLSALVSGDVDEIRVVTPPRNGALRLETVAGTVRPAAVTGSSVPMVTAVYTSNPGYVGPDSFSIVAVGPGGTSAPATINLNIVGLDPTAPNLTATTEQGRPVTVNLTRTATEGPFTAANILSISPTGSATAALVQGGTTGNRTFEMTVTPRASFEGTVIITYTLSNTFGVSAPATVTVTVSARPDPSADPDVRALSTAQAQAARQFAVTQLGNFNRRNEQLHDDAGGQAPALNITLAGGPRGLVDGPLGDLPWAERERQLANERVTSLADLPDRVGSGDTAALGTAAGEQPARSGGPRETGDIAVWSGGAITVGGFDQTARTSSFDISTSGLSAGADVKVNDRLTLGAGGGYGSQRTDIGENETGRLDGETWTGAAYGSYRPVPGVFIDGVLGYGSLSFDTRRLAVNGLIAQGERDGDMVMASLTSGWDRQSGASVFSTYGRVDYVLTTLDGYSETGAGLYNLAFDEREFESVVGALGVRGQRQRDFRDSTLIQTGRLEWRHEFSGLDGQALDYADIGGFRYVIDGERWMRDELAVELGLEMRYENGLVLGIDVGGRLSNSSNDATLRLLLAKRF